METNIILCGVGGQGILSISVVIDMAALKLGWHFKQAEVHGMSQRGGEVSATCASPTTRSTPTWSPRARRTLILSVEPLESLRYVDSSRPEARSSPASTRS